MEFSVSPNSTLETSSLDKDDINGPGLEKYIKRTGDKSVDYALYKISQYSNSSEIAERVKFTKELDELALQLGYRNISSLHNVIKKLGKEEILEVRIELAGIIPNLANIFIKDFQAYTDIIDHLIPVLDLLLEDKRQDVLKAACNTGIKLAEILNKEDRGSFILTMILRILHDDDEEIKIRALSALKELIKLLTPDICEWYIVKEAMLLSSENIVKVRKAIAECIPRLSRLVQESESFEKLMRIFQELSKDSIWGVRKACVEDISEMFEGLNELAQETYILPIFLELLNDKSNSVRHHAMLQLGPCIYNCKISVPEDLITQYTNLSKNASNKGEFQYHCAYYFPAIIAKLGKNEWNKLSVAFSCIINEGDFKSKKCLVSSIHEIGKILEPEIATYELTPIYDDIFSANTASKQVAFTVLSKFLPVILPRARLNFLKYIKIMYKTNISWRIRQLIAEQIGEIIELFDFDVVINELVPVILALSDDKIAKVREKSAISLGKVVNYILNKSENHSVLGVFLNYANDSSIKKLVFAIACQIITSYARFPELFGKEFHRLCDDKSANVRLCCAKAIRIAINSQKASNFWILLEEKLSHDFDADVRYEVSGKYDVERGIIKLRPNNKNSSELMPPMFRALFPDDDIQEIIHFQSNTFQTFAMLKNSVIPSMNGFVEHALLQNVNKQKMLIDI